MLNKNGFSSDIENNLKLPENSDIPKDLSKTPEASGVPERPGDSSLELPSIGGASKRYFEMPLRTENKIPLPALSEKVENNASADNGEHVRSDSKNDVKDTNEDGLRSLTDDEKQNLKDKLGWSDDKIDNCKIDENGVIHIKTDCQDREGKTADCGVRYERRTIEYNGVKIEGVFPVFESKFDTYLSEDDYKRSNVKQFSECNKSLKEAVNNDPELRKQFTDEQLKDIENGNTPRGYTWHHSEEPGKMQLVRTEDHDRRIGGAAHTGGNSIWGNRSVEKDGSDLKGESF